MQGAAFTHGCDKSRSGATSPGYDLKEDDKHPKVTEMYNYKRGESFGLRAYAEDRYIFTGQRVEKEFPQNQHHVQRPCGRKSHQVSSSMAADAAGDMGGSQAMPRSGPLK